VNIEEGDRRPAPLKETQATTLDMVAQAAISPERRDSIELPSDNATPESVYNTAMKLRAGQMLERILASTLVRRYRDPLAVFMCALDKNAKSKEIESIAPWLRFSLGREGIESIAQSICKNLNLAEVDAIRMKALLTGWSGSTMLPIVDWNDRWCREKFSSSYVRAYLHAAWRDQAENSLRFLTHSCIDANAHYRSYYEKDFHFFQFLSAVKGIPASKQQNYFDRDSHERSAECDDISAPLQNVRHSNR
jgi:hypothetical protein